MDARAFVSRLPSSTVQYVHNDLCSGCAPLTAPRVPPKEKKTRTSRSPLLPPRLRAALRTGATQRDMKARATHAAYATNREEETRGGGLIRVDVIRRQLCAGDERYISQGLPRSGDRTKSACVHACVVGR
ncbi:hypothetical protein HPB50_022616 [Hyalomma asiaticum]|uniref:Uncharacterized protein n=1 Tax=Hyalomma asiaticum TaxID=266040 RepID=A0ACB7TML9_HYAAI|nr:hypothetical protein HPB50_022616 [Hyalomma asiaticum]